ncbi:MAG: flagellar hook capping protein [Epsilonproteobacteria bacterium]|nr:flagellar hook capping protein [Campylobacterota bacterium]
MDVTSTTQVTTTTSSDFTYNPDSALTSDDFLKLFMTELQYQDPTAPMETKDMLEQTSQLTQLQTNQDLKDALSSLTNQLSSSTEFSAVSMIGKMVDTGNNGFAVNDADNLSSDIPFDLYFGDDFTSATVKITDRNGDVIRSIDLSDGGSKGITSFSWDGKDDDGNPVADGEYYVKADYTTTDGEQKTTMLGVYPVESVRFDNGKAQVKVDNKYMALDDIKEVY